MLIGINLLNFESNKIDGVGYLTKRILAILQKRQDKNKYLLMVPYGFNCKEVLDIYNDEKFEIITFPKFHNALSRVFYKMFIYPIVLRKYDMDIIYSPAPPISPFINKKIGVVTNVNDLNPLLVDRKQGRILKYYYKAIAIIASARSDMVITISENSKKDLIEILKVDPSKISIMNCFVTGMEYQQYPHNNFFIAVSTIQPGKNIERMIKAFKIFLDHYEDKTFKFYIIGRDGWGTKAIKELPKRLKLTDNVIFLGYVSDEKLSWYYKNCAALIHASLYEGFGMPPLEAMYYGKPSVVSNVSSLPEVVGKAGILVDQNNHESIAEGLIKVMTPDLRKQLLKQIPDQIKKFEPDNQINILMDVFKKVEVFKKNKNNMPKKD